MSHSGLILQLPQRDGLLLPPEEKAEAAGTGSKTGAALDHHRHGSQQETQRLVRECCWQLQLLTSAQCEDWWCQGQMASHPSLLHRACL